MANMVGTTRGWLDKDSFRSREYDQEHRTIGSVRQILLPLPPGPLGTHAVAARILTPGW